MPPRVFAFGSNGSNQLGVGHNDDLSAPQRCLLPEDLWVPGETIVQIAAGGNHTLLLTSEGRVLASGSNEDGRCGRPGDDATSSIFHPVDLPLGNAHAVKDRVTHIAATWEASIFVINGHQVYSCGTGMRGELGLGKGVTKTDTPRLVCDLGLIEGNRATVTSVETAMGHVILLTSDGELYGWGSSRKGQLGDDAKSEKTVWVPRKVALRTVARSAAAGRDFTYVVDVRSRAQLLGDHRHFQDLPGIESANPDDVILAGWSNIFLWQQQRVVGFGRDDHGQLPPKDLSPLRLFAVGSEHCLACTTDHALVAWGWGEHGNCGSPVNGPGGGVACGNTISLDLAANETVSMVAAGCATSFVVVTGSSAAGT